MNKQCTGCVVSAGTHKPAEAMHQQIDEPQADAMRGNTAGGVRCHDADACAMGQLPCPTPGACGCAPAPQAVQAAEPEGWKLVTVVPTSEMLGAADREHAARGLVSIALISYQAMLAAAPQPPEAVQSNSDEFDGIEKAAAPVGLPEPFTSLVRKKSWSPNCYEASPLSRAKDYGRQWADERINVYTEQQVRDLLANHGIKVNQ